MINFNKTSGFITLTIVLIIVLLVTAITLMTGKMLLGEQRSASNQMRYQEAANAAQFGLDKAIAQLMNNFDNQVDFENISSPPYYHVEFINMEEISIGSNAVPVITIKSVGTSGYSANADDENNAESKVTINQQVISISPISATPASPLTVAAGMAAGGNFSVAANPNGGGPGVPISIWSAGEVNIGSSSSTCGQQEYYDGTCSSQPYSSNQSGKNSDVVDNDEKFPDDLLAYIFNGSTSVDDVKNDVISLYGVDSDEHLLTNCSTLNVASSGIYVIEGNCTPPGDVGTRDKPVILLVVNGDLTLNANKEIYGLVFAYTDAANVNTVTYDIKLNGGATIYGALVANYKLGNSNGTYNAVYDAETLGNLPESVGSIVATVPGSWRDW